ncbi:MAG: DUF433 domain-containing protein [Duganella sp.]
MNQKVFHSDPDIMGGKPVFPGTRVPASYLFDYLGSGESIVPIQTVGHMDKQFPNGGICSKYAAQTPPVHA